VSILHLVLGAVVLFTLVVGVIDARTGHIPNRLLVVGLVSGVTLHAASYVLLSKSQPLAETLLAALLSILAGLLLCAAAPLLLFRLQAMGGGDVKLLGVIGATLGPFMGLEIELYAFVLLALFAAARLAYHGELLRMLGNSAALVKNPFVPKPRRREVPRELLTVLPFGPAVFVAALLVCVSKGIAS
jgi:prepilin peptidase CpaA